MSLPPASQFSPPPFANFAKLNHPDVSPERNEQARDVIVKPTLTAPA